jgi:hypothetical protein
MSTSPFLFSALLLVVFLCSSFQPRPISKDKFRPGYYLDATGKVEGFINFEYDSYEKFDFKKELADKETTKNVNECTGFSVDGKTFCVIENVQMKIGVWKVSAEKAFAELLVQGSLSLYKVYSMVGSSSTTMHGVDEVHNYFLEKGYNKNYILAPPAKGKFRDQMMDFFQDRIDIAEKIDDGSYNLNNIVEIVKDYNSKANDRGDRKVN